MKFMNAKANLEFILLLTFSLIIILIAVVTKAGSYA
jgi:hypothetical protein